MFGLGKRLIALLNLAAYLLGSLHPSFAMCAQPDPVPATAASTQAQSHVATETNEQAQEHSNCCEDCCENVEFVDIPIPDDIPVSEELPNQDTGESDNSNESDESQSPHDYSCPCCPGQPSDGRCPCPENCTFCNAAKVPALVDCAILHLCAPPTGERIAAERQVESLRYIGELFRPPRI